MSDPVSFDSLRHAALGMLADGNSAESVAHVLAVPLEVVAGWRAAPIERVPATPLSSIATPARARPVRFDTTLEYAASTTFRRINLVSAIVLGIVNLWLLAEFGGQIAKTGVGGIAALLSILLVSGIGINILLKLSRVSLVLDPDRLIVPGLVDKIEMPYSDVAGHSLEPSTMNLGRGSSLKGEMLTIRSRRPGAAPLEVFIFSNYPLDLRVLARLDEAQRANEGGGALASSRPAIDAVHARPDVARRPAATPTARDGGSVLLMIAIAVLGAFQFLPMLSQGMHQLTRGTPALDALEHHEGRVTASSTCYKRYYKSSEQAMKVVVEEAASSAVLVVPCVIDHAVLMGPQPHRVAVDLDPRGSPPGRVYQVALDGQVVLAYDTVKADDHRYLAVPALIEVIGPLMALGFLGFVVYKMLTRGRGEGDVDAR